MRSEISNRNQKTDQLKCLFVKYSDSVVNFEIHVNRLLNDKIINIRERKSMMIQLDEMMHGIIKIYNQELILLSSQQKDQKNQKIKKKSVKIL